jgi:hypothetical protein
MMLLKRESGTAAPAGRTVVGVLKAPGDPAVRSAAFLADYQAAKGDRHVSAGIGWEGDENAPAVIIGINGRKHGFSVREARILADCAEASMHESPEVAVAEGIPLMILMLRTAADKAEEAATSLEGSTVARDALDLKA